MPAGTEPAAISTSWAATATSPLACTSSSGSPRASAVTRNDGAKLWSPWSSRPGLSSAGGVPKPITSKIRPGDGRADMSAYSSIST